MTNLSMCRGSSEPPLLDSAITYSYFMPVSCIVYSYFMPVCSIVKTITPRCRGRPDALLHEAKGRVQ